MAIQPVQVDTAATAQRPIAQRPIDVMFNHVKTEYNLRYPLFWKKNGRSHTYAIFTIVDSYAQAHLKVFIPHQFVKRCIPVVSNNVLHAKDKREGNDKISIVMNNNRVTAPVIYTMELRDVKDPLYLKDLK